MISVKNILITGSSRGIGKEIALYYLNKGFKVIGLSRGESTIQHQQYIHFSCDISDEASVIETVRSIKKSLGSVDVLINNAAVAGMNQMMTTPVSTFDKISNINFKGTFLMMREVGKLMIKQNTGRIINFSSLSAALNLETQSIYAASKAAIESLTRTSAKELASFNITVNCIAPTPMEMGLIKGIPDEWLNQVIQMQAIKRKGTLEDIYHILDFYISEQASFITGQVIYMGGVW